MASAGIVVGATADLPIVAPTAATKADDVCLAFSRQDEVGLVPKGTANSAAGSILPVFGLPDSVGYQARGRTTSCRKTA